MWKQKLGSGATYSNLIQVFEKADHKDLADVVREIVRESAQVQGSVASNVTVTIESGIRNSSPDSAPAVVVERERD